MVKAIILVINNTPQKTYRIVQYNCAAIGLACAQATAMRIDIAPHKRPRRKAPQQVPDPHHFHIPPHALQRD